MRCALLGLWFCDVLKQLKPGVFFMFSKCEVCQNQGKN
uniref:Uncharacterized protein n=1 Tax=Anguilla anguilla TaxID=7936 RepID=A0A0E9Q816_ANGAN